MEENKQFDKQVKENIASLSCYRDMHDLSRIWLRDTLKHRYSYNFTWMSRPIIQYPQDIVAMQELIWTVKPDLIIETGIAHGGSLIFSASMLAQLDMAEAIEEGVLIDPKKSNRKVLGIDIDIREHNRIAIEEHPMSSRIQMIQGSSIAPEIIDQVKEVAKDYKRILVCLDSNHTHEHVLAELEAYAPHTSIGSYCVVFDTIIEDLPDDMFPDRPWGKGNNPKTAVFEYLRRLDSRNVTNNSHNDIEFEIVNEIDSKLLISVAPSGYLRRIR